MSKIQQKEIFYIPIFVFAHSHSFVKNTYFYTYFREIYTYFHITSCSKMRVNTYFWNLLEYNHILLIHTMSRVNKNRYFENVLQQSNSSHFEKFLYLFLSKLPSHKIQKTPIFIPMFEKFIPIFALLYKVNRYDDFYILSRVADTKIGIFDLILDTKIGINTGE